MRGWTKRSCMCVLVLRALIANVDPGNKLSVEDSCYFFKFIRNNFNVCNCLNIVNCS